MSLAEREREIARTRDRLGETLERIGDKLTLSGMVDEALGSGRLPAFETSYGRALDAVRNNPIPVLLVAAGIGYVLNRIAKRERRGRVALGLGDAPIVNDGRARRYDPAGDGPAAVSDGRRLANG